MANFKEYLAQELNKTTDEKVKTTRIIKESNDTSLDDVVKSLKPEIWTAREIKGIKFLFFGGKMLNITELMPKKFFQSCEGSEPHVRLTSLGI